MSHFSKQLLKFAVLILLINMVGMWVLFYLDHQRLVELNELNNMPAKNVTGTVKKTDTDLRLQMVENSQEQLVGRMDELESSVEAIEEAQSEVKTPVVQQSSSNSNSSTAKKEYSIYLGEGSSYNREWETVQSTTISIDTRKYPGISAVYFESALSIVGGEAYAQLIEASSGSVISSSVLVNNNQSPTWKSQQVNLQSGTHIYVVQLKSSSGELATLSGARIRIIAD